jgi:ABC-type phosphate/phosphonate transport system substrate-binding protein
MYDWPEVQWANDALWAAIRDRLRASGIAAPENLDRNTPREELWTDPALVLSQTCAWPYVTRLTGRVALVATPVYDVDGCVGPLYSSFLIARADQRRARLSAFRGLRFAFNAGDSLSGYVALRQAMKSEGLGLSDVDWHETGGHRASLLAVSGGVADLAAIDAVCWALAGRHDAAAVAGLRVVSRTPLRPGLPLISDRDADPARLDAIRGALREVLRDAATLKARQALFLAGFDVVPEAEYQALAGLAG